MNLLQTKYSKARRATIITFGCLIEWLLHRCSNCVSRNAFFWRICFLFVFFRAKPQSAKIAKGGRVCIMFLSALRVDVNCLFFLI